MVRPPCAKQSCGLHVEAVEFPRQAMPRHYFIKTFGCQMNEYDSARMADVLRAGAGAHGHRAIRRQADVLLMNTCSVREKAQEKVFSLLGEWRQLKARRPEVIIGVGGCVASQEGEAITARAPFVDLVFGPQTLHRLPADDRRAAPHRACRGRRAAFRRSRSSITCRRRAPKGACAYVSVMEGCSKYCSFCIVPYTRGEEVSRGFDSVLEEVRAARRARACARSRCSARTSTPTAGAMADGARLDLATLIHHVARVPGIERIRFTTSHPLEFNDSLIEAYASVAAARQPPAPAGAERLGPRARAHEARLHGARVQGQGAPRCAPCARTSRSPPTSSSAFPGESERDFEATLALVREVGFDQSFSFLYSRRPGTPGGLAARRGAAGGEAAAPARGCRRSSKPRRAPSAQRWSAARSACWSSAAEARYARARRPHRQQPLGQLRRAARRCSAASPT